MAIPNSNSIKYAISWWQKKCKKESKEKSTIIQAPKPAPSQVLPIPVVQIARGDHSTTNRSSLGIGL